MGIFTVRRGAHAHATCLRDAVQQQENVSFGGQHLVEGERVTVETQLSCQNCRAVLVGPFCAQCGQEARSRRASLRALSGEFLEEAFSLDSKLLTSLRLLLFKPGFLTAEYLAGRRVHYLRPFRIFLLATALFFLLPGLIPPGIHWSAHLEPGAKIGHLNLARDDGGPFGGSFVGYTSTSRGRVLSADEAREARRRSDDALLKKDKGVVGNFLFARSAQLFEGGEENAAARFNRAFGSVAQKAMFVLVPLFALILKLLYRRGFFYVEHLVVALHFNAVLFLATLAALYLWRLPILIPLLVVVVAVHLFLTLRRVYQQRVLLTSLKFGLLYASYCSVLAVAVAFTVLGVLFEI